MKILVTGKNGQLGSELVRAFRGVAEVAAFDRQTLDLADIGQLRSLIRAQAPDVIINAAAYTRHRARPIPAYRWKNSR
jgi:dTDP-4-dehydrorhamnose reductase